MRRHGEETGRACAGRRGQAPAPPASPAPDRGRGEGRGRAGFALVFVLLGMLAALGVASAAVAAAIGQARSASAAGSVAQARVGAKAALERVLAEVRDTSVAVVGGPAVPLPVRELSARVSWSVVALRLSAEFHLLIGEARTPEGVAWREGRIAWWMHPVARVADHRAVVESPSAGPGTTVAIDSLLAARPSVPSARPDVPGCGHVTEIARAFGGSAPFRRCLPSPPGESGHSGPNCATVRLGPLDWPRLRDMADRVLPDSALASGWLGLVAGRGSVVVDAAGAGVLVVDGDLTLAPGGSWTGLALVSGTVALQGTASFLGLVRSGGGVVAAPGAVVDGSPCAALESLYRAPALLRPVAAPGRSWAGPISPGAK